MPVTYTDCQRLVFDLLSITMSTKGWSHFLSVLIECKALVCVFVTYTECQGLACVLV